MTPLHTGLPLRHYHADRYVCLDDHRFAHPVNAPSCDCMRRKPPLVALRVLGALAFMVGFPMYLGGMALAGWGLHAGERRKEERLERR